MIIKNVEIETETKYEDDGDSMYGRSSKQTPILKLKIKVPGGQAIYEIPIGDDIRSSIEKASELQK